LYKEGHLSQGLKSDFHPLLGQLRRRSKEREGMHQKYDTKEKDSIAAKTVEQTCHVRAAFSTPAVAKPIIVAKRPSAMRQVIYTKVKTFSAPSSWFPGVPTALDGGVYLFPTHAHKIGKGKAMLFCELEDGFS